MTSQPAILLLGSKIAVGGAQRVLLAQASWFHARGWKVIVAFVYDREGLRAAWQARYPFPIYDLNAYHLTARILNPLSLMRGLVRLARLILRHKIRAIETFTPHANLFGIPLAFLLGVPNRVATHHGRPNNYARGLERIHSLLVNSGLATTFVAVSPSARMDALQGGIAAERIRVILNGVDIPPENLVPPEGMRAALGLPARGEIVLSVGRLISQKAHIDLIRAVPAVLERCPQALFAIAGDGPQRGELEHEIERLGVGSSVRLLGSRDDIREIMSIATLFVLPSVSEGLPMAVLEAMASGLPVIGTHVLSDFLDHDVNGLLVPERDAPALSGALIALLNDPDRRRRLGEAGRKRIREQYTTDIMCAEYARVLYPEATAHER